MSHDITAHLKKREDPELYSFNRTCSDDITYFYEVLKCEEFNGSFSGIGKGKTFKREEILEALELMLLYDDPDIRELLFLTRCAKHDKIYIHFS